MAGFPECLISNLGPCYSLIKVYSTWYNNYYDSYLFSYIIYAQHTLHLLCSDTFNMYHSAELLVGLLAITTLATQSGE